MEKYLNYEFATGGKSYAVKFFGGVMIELLGIKSDFFCLVNRK
jgi:hypothetical protein